MKEYVLPCKIIKEEGIFNSSTLLKKKSKQIGFHEEGAEIKDGGFIVLDFGKEMCGGVRILAAFVIPDHYCTVRLCFGESLTETYSSIGEKNATNNHAARDFEYPLVSLSDCEVGKTGYRFLRIDFPKGKRIKIKSILGTNEILMRKPINVYSGTDEQVKAIFQTAKRTIDLCAASGYLWDGIKRDRLVWIGDVHPEMLALTSLYGRTKIVERSLEFVKKDTPLPLWMNNYPTYSAWWIIIVADYYKMTHCEKFVEKQLKYLSGIIDQCLECVDADGCMNFPAYFVDWPTRNTEDELVGVRAIYQIAAKSAIELLSEFGKSYKNAETLLQRLKGVPMVVKEKKQVLALKFWAEGEISDEEYAMLIEGGCKGFSTFMSYYILTAIAHRDKDLAVKLMKEYYGAMLEKGATTFWEDFDVSWCEDSGRIDCFPAKGQKDIHGDFGAYCYSGFRHSLCHGWSSGVIKFILENEL